MNNLSDPATFVLLVILGGLVAFGIIQTAIWIVARGILLSESMRLHEKQKKELDELKRRGKQ